MWTSITTINPTSKPEDVVSKVILTNVQVLAAGTKIETSEKDNKPIQVSVVTLMVSPEEAERLTLASTEGKIQLALRNPMDKTAPATSGIKPEVLVAGGLMPTRPVVPARRDDGWRQRRTARLGPGSGSGGARPADGRDDSRRQARDRSGQPGVVTMRMFRPATTPRMAALAVPVFVILVFGGVIHAQQPVLTTVSAAVPEPSTPDTLRLLVGRSTLVDIGTPISRVSLTSADIADALVTSPNQLLVHGKVPGSISMFVWSRGGEVRRFEVAVQRDLSRLAEQVHQLFPGDDIQVRGNGRSVVLSGTVGSKDVVDRAVNVAMGFVDKKEDVVTLLQVRDSRVSNQVLLKVRFAEVSRSAMTEFGMSFFTSPTGVKNTVGRVTTQQFPAPTFEDLQWTKANSDFGREPTSSSGKLSFSDFLNVFLLNQK